MDTFDELRGNIAAWHERRDRVAVERFFRGFLPRVRARVARRFPQEADRLRLGPDIEQAVAERFLTDARVADATGASYWDRAVDWDISNVRRKAEGGRPRRPRSDAEPVTASPTGGAYRPGVVEFDDAVHSAEVAETRGPSVTPADEQLIRGAGVRVVRKALAGLPQSRRVAVILQFAQPLDLLSLGDLVFLAEKSCLSRDALLAKLDAFEPGVPDAVLAVRFSPSEHRDKAGRNRCLEALGAARNHGIRALAKALREDREEM